MILIKILCGIIILYFVVGMVSACLLSSKISQSEENQFYDFIYKNIKKVKGEKDGTN